MCLLTCGYVFSCSFVDIYIVCTYTYRQSYSSTGGNGPAALVLAGPVFLKVKVKFHFYEKQVANKQKC